MQYSLILVVGKKPLSRINFCSLDLTWRTEANRAALQHLLKRRRKKAHLSLAEGVEGEERGKKKQKRRGKMAAVVDYPPSQTDL